MTRSGYLTGTASRSNSSLRLNGFDRHLDKVRRGRGENRGRYVAVCSPSFSTMSCTFSERSSCLDAYACGRWNPGHVKTLESAGFIVAYGNLLLCSSSGHCSKNRPNLLPLSLRDVRRFRY
jgi:hypothetical protein